MLTKRDLYGVLDVLHELATEPSDGDYLSVLARALPRLSDLARCDNIGYTAVRPGPRTLLGGGDSAAGAPQARIGLDAVIDQHPGFRAHQAGTIGRGAVVALSDLVEQRTLRRLPLYTDFYRPRGTRDQLIGVLRVDARMGAVVTFNRSRLGFSARDREVMTLLLPHLRLAHRRQERLAMLTRAARVAGRHRHRLDAAAERLSLLTKREREVVAHLSSGATDRQIAVLLGISERTVHRHLRHVYEKLGLANRASVIALTLA